MKTISLYLITVFMCQRSFQKKLYVFQFQFLFNFSPAKAGLRPVSTPVLDKSRLNNLAPKYPLENRPQCLKSLVCNHTQIIQNRNDKRHKTKDQKHPGYPDKPIFPCCNFLKVFLRIPA